MVSGKPNKEKKLGVFSQGWSELTSTSKKVLAKRHVNLVSPWVPPGPLAMPAMQYKPAYT